MACVAVSHDGRPPQWPNIKDLWCATACVASPLALRGCTRHTFWPLLRLVRRSPCVLTFCTPSGSPCLVASLNRKHAQKAAFHTSNIAWSAKLNSSILEVYPVKSFSGRGVNGLTMRNHHQQSTAGYKATSSPCTSMGFQSEHESSREPRQTQALQGACCIICSVLFSPSSGFQHPSSIRILRVHHEFRLGVWDRPRLSAQRSPSAWPTAIWLDSTAFLLGYTSATSRKKLEVFFNTSRNKQQNQNEVFRNNI